MSDLFTLFMGNSFGMYVANTGSMILFIVLGWFVLENLYFPELVKESLNDYTHIALIPIPNDLIFFGYVFVCIVALILL